MTNTRMKESTTAFLGQPSSSPLKARRDIEGGMAACFILENESYLEMRDCFV